MLTFLPRLSSCRAPADGLAPGDELRDLYLTAREVAKKTGLGANAVHDGRRGLRAAVRVGRVKLWLREEVEAWSGF